jgi:predicted MFS family arabinose efflux permease
MDRKRLLLGLTLLMIASGTLVAVAPTFLTFLIGRALVGASIGGFWAMSAATAIRLVPEKDVTRALAIVNGGNALATVVAAPLGSYAASLVGWRWASFFVVPVAAIALVWKLVSMPSMRALPTSGSGNVFKLLQRRDVALGMLAVNLFFMGQFILFTYLRPFLETITLVDARTLSALLLLMGVAGVGGTMLIGRFLRHGLYGALIAMPILMALIAASFITLGSTLGATAALLGAWGLVATAAPVGWWTWVARTLPHDAETGGGLMVAVAQLAIGLGATVGGLIYDSSGYQLTFGASALFLMLSSAVSLITARTAVDGREISLPEDVSEQRHEFAMGKGRQLLRLS